MGEGGVVMRRCSGRRAMGSRRHDCRRLVGLWSNVRSVFRSVIEILTRVLFDRCGFEFMLAWVYGTDGDGRDERWWSEAMVQVHHVHVCTLGVWTFSLGKTKGKLGTVSCYWQFFSK